jgi:hypothetical protein
MSIDSRDGVMTMICLSQEELKHVMHAVRKFDAIESHFYQQNPAMITEDTQKLMTTIKKMSSYKI